MLELLHPGFDRTFTNWGAAPPQGPEAEGACPVLFCNLLHDVWQTP